MDEAISMLIEKDAIVDIVTRLFVATDERDWQRVKDCLADRVLFDMTSLSGAEPELMTPDQIVAGWESGLSGITAIHHQVGNFLVDLGDGEAEVCCYGIALHYLPNPTELNTRSFVGSYDMHLSRDGERWQIDRFRFNLKFLGGNLELGR